MAKPIVDGLERELEGQARVVRLDVLTKLGREVAQSHDVRSVPTFLIFDGQGNLTDRQVGFPDRGRIRALVTGS
jgi:thioredoxin-related protein